PGGAAAARPGRGIAVVEADESDGSFLAFTPRSLVVTNLEADHLDFHGDPVTLTAAFDTLTGQLETDGTLVVCADDPGARALGERAARTGTAVISYGAAPHASPPAIAARSWASSPRAPPPPSPPTAPPPTRAGGAPPSAPERAAPRSSSTPRTVRYASNWRWPDTTTSSTPWERWPRSPPPRRTSTRRRWPPAWPPSPGPRAASTSPASRAASRSWTTTRTTRARSPPPSRPPAPSSRRSSVGAACWWSSSRTCSRAPVPSP